MNPYLAWLLEPQTLRAAILVLTLWLLVLAPIVVSACLVCGGWNNAIMFAAIRSVTILFHGLAVACVLDGFLLALWGLLLTVPLHGTLLVMAEPLIDMPGRWITVRRLTQLAYFIVGAVSNGMALAVAATMGSGDAFGVLVGLLHGGILAYVLWYPPPAAVAAPVGATRQDTYTGGCS